MERKDFSIPLGAIIKEFNLEVLHGSKDFENIPISTDDPNRPGLQLAGFFDYFDPNRLQIIGSVETTFLGRFTPERRTISFSTLFEKKIPALIITRSIEPFAECLAMAEKYGIPVLRTDDYTSGFTAALISYLKVALAPRVTRSGVLVEVYGEGILLLGDSGVGKSETAIELVKRGHRLIADDAVVIKKVSAKTLVGTAPEIIRHFVELRGIGIIDVRRLFGMGAVKFTEKIDLIIHLEPWVDGKNYDRLGAETQTTNLMDIEIPSLTVPVKPGRNLAIIIEVAAMNHRQKELGYNAAQDLSAKIYEDMQRHQK